MAFLGLFGNYDKPGPGVNKDEPQKAAPIRFFEIYFRKFSKLVQVNLIFFLPVMAVAALMVLIYMMPTHLVLQIPSGENIIYLDIWALFVMPVPIILLFPFMAGITYVTRNFAREEHAFVWSDFWTSVKNNWKLFLLNGLLFYGMFFLMGFAMIYYYNSAATNSLLYVPFWVCVVISVVFLFAQYYLPIIFVTFDLKFRQAYRNALIFTVAGLFRNLLITVILVGLYILIFEVIPIMSLTAFLLFLFAGLLCFSFISFLVNFTVYPVIDRYMIKPYEKKLDEEKYGAPEKEEPDDLDEKYHGLFSQAPEEDESEEEDQDEKYVYVNGKLVKKSELDGKD